MNFKDNIRSALSLGITENSLEDWIFFRSARNKTSHVYNEKISNEVYQVAKKFSIEIRKTYNLLLSKINKNKEHEN